MASCKYTPERIDLMWNAIAFNDRRKFAFLTNKQRWMHPNRHFDSAAQLLDFIVANAVSDVHVKPLDEGGREWVVDADFKNCADQTELELRINVGASAFLHFFADKEDAVQRVLFSGNRGFHLWLRFCGRFRVDASKAEREFWFGVFKRPSKLVPADIRPGNFAYSVRQALGMYADVADDECSMVVRYWPDVDRDVFCNPTKQIRAPFSYNYKGNQYSRCLTQQLFKRIAECSTGYAAGGPTAL
ncbi:late expression factor 1 [Samia ricini nucleopolyhedrovirus]|nr:late expression factor 1 [Samia ricini nucleopolyhedrovirus]BBD51354.1 late expression factor 1 [Samia ricini nucleopolyhedrovirus]BBD51506.1 late expression factor 1 [Samia ricini nucleopolyhedrovirus]